MQLVGRSQHSFEISITKVSMDVQQVEGCYQEQLQPVSLAAKLNLIVETVCSVSSSPHECTAHAVSVCCMNMGNNTRNMAVHRALKGNKSGTEG